MLNCSLIIAIPKQKILENFENFYETKQVSTYSFKHLSALNLVRPISDTMDGFSYSYELLF